MIALIAAFQPFIDQKIDISPLSSLTPSYEIPPSVNDQGQLPMVGNYAADAKAVHFDLKYVKEDDQWKLIGIVVNAE